MFQDWRMEESFRNRARLLEDVQRTLEYVRRDTEYKSNDREIISRLIEEARGLQKLYFAEFEKLQYKRLKEKFEVKEDG